MVFVQLNIVTLVGLKFYPIIKVENVHLMDSLDCQCAPLYGKNKSTIFFLLKNTKDVCINLQKNISMSKCKVLKKKNTCTSVRPLIPFTTPIGDQLYQSI